MFDFMPPPWLEKVLSPIVLALIIVWGRDRKSQQERSDRTDQAVAALRAEVREWRAEIKDLLNDAGEHTSDLATVVQGLPERLRKEWTADIKERLELQQRQRR